MSGNVLIICITVIICAVLLAFCHYQEHQCDISDDRYQYLCGQIEDLRKQNNLFDQRCDRIVENIRIMDCEISSGFEERDDRIDDLCSRVENLKGYVVEKLGL